MKLNFKRALIYFVYSYIIVTILAYGLSAIVGFMLKLPPSTDPGASIFEDPVFLLTVPYHLLINLVCWAFFGYLYLMKEVKDNSGLKEAAYLGCLWLAVALPVDLIGFVLIRHPYSLTPHEFYIEYQPWISITYLIVLISPVISSGFINLAKSFKNRPAARLK